MVLNDWPDVDPECRPTRPNILFLFFPEVVSQGALQAGGRRYQHQSVDVEPAIAEDHRSGCLVPLVDRKINGTDQNRQLTGRSRPGFPMNSSQKGRVDPVDLVLHAADNCGSSTR
jgi:hypothetical protein